jgi:hypothetical protein
MRRHLVTPKIPANQAMVHYIPFLVGAARALTVVADPARTNMG